MNNQTKAKQAETFKLEHIKGRYIIYTKLILYVVVLLTGYFINKGSGKATVTKSNQVNAKEYKNSPIANDIQTQNNFYAPFKNTQQTASVEQKPKEIKSVVYKEKKSAIKLDSTIKETQPQGIVNNGNMVVGNGNTISQTYNANSKPTPRTFTEEDLLKILSIPKDYIIELLYHYDDDECYKYTTEIINALNTLKYNFTVSSYGIIGGVKYNQRFTLEIDNNLKKANMTVFELK